MKTKAITWSDFSYALKTPFMMPSSKGLIKLAVEGKLKEYGKALANYRWPGTRDYTMTMIAMTPIILAKNAKDDDCGKLLKGIQDPAVRELFKRIGTGEGSDVKKFIDKSSQLKNYRLIFKRALETAGIDEDKQEKVWEDFTKQLGKISKWRFSDVKPLIKLVDDTFSGQVADALEDAVNISGEPEVEEPKKEEPRKEDPRKEEPKPELAPEEATRGKLLHHKAREAEDLTYEDMEEQRKKQRKEQQEKHSPFIDKTGLNLPKRLPEMFDVLRNYDLNETGIKSAEKYVNNFSNDPEGTLKELRALVKCGQELEKVTFIPEIIKEYKVKKSVVLVVDLLNILPDINDGETSKELYTQIVDKMPDSHFKESVISKIDPTKVSFKGMRDRLWNWLNSWFSKKLEDWTEDPSKAPKAPEAPKDAPPRPNVSAFVTDDPKAPKAPTRASEMIRRLNEKLQHKLTPQEELFVGALNPEIVGSAWDEHEWEKRTDKSKRVIMAVRSLRNHAQLLNKNWKWDECLAVLQKNPKDGVFVYIATLFEKIYDDGQREGHLKYLRDKKYDDFADRLNDYLKVRKTNDISIKPAPNAKPKFRELYETLRKIGVKDLATAERQVISIFGVNEGTRKNKKLRLLAEASEKLAANQDVKDFMKAINTRSPGQLVDSMILCADIESALRTIRDNPSVWKDLCDAARYKKIYNALEASWEGDSESKKKYKTKHVLPLQPTPEWENKMNAADAAYSKGIWNKFGIGKLWDMVGLGANVLEAHMETPAKPAEPDGDGLRVPIDEPVIAADVRNGVNEYLRKAGNKEISDEEEPLILALGDNCTTRAKAEFVLWLRRVYDESILNDFKVRLYAVNVARYREIACSYLVDLAVNAAAESKRDKEIVMNWIGDLRAFLPDVADALVKQVSDRLRSLRESKVTEKLGALLKRTLTKDEAEFVKRYVKSSELKPNKCAEELVIIINGLRVVQEQFTDLFRWDDIESTKKGVYEYARILISGLEHREKNEFENELKVYHKAFYDELKKA